MFVLVVAARNLARDMIILLLCKWHFNLNFKVIFWGNLLVEGIPLVVFLSIGDFLLFVVVQLVAQETGPGSSLM